jgi:FecR protein
MLASRHISDQRINLGLQPGLQLRVPHPCEARVDLSHPFTTKLILLIFTLLFAIGAVASAQPPQEASLPIGSAVVGEVKGVVTVLSPQGTPVSFERGQLLEAGSTIETGKGSVVLNLQDGSQILVRPNSRVVLQSPADSAGQYLQLMLGKIWAKVQKRFANAPSFRMGTPSAVITVRGTEFTVELGKKNETFVYVREGIVEVAQRGAEDHSVLLNPGYFTRVQPNQAPDEPRQHIRDDQNVINDLRSGRGADFDPDDSRPTSPTPGRQPGESGGEEHESESKPPGSLDLNY